MAKTKAARDSGRHEKAPTPFAPPPALLAQDLAALCRERMLSSPNFVALVGTTLPAAAASAPSADDGTNDLLLDLSEENLPIMEKRAKVNFTDEERGVLTDLVNKYREVLENKKTDAVSLQRKQRT
ncbi:hypothetical protein HPB52_000079 [Rhipicephalus sanguineus]|uniref:Regulatory protein zeste n=1 Tax=Rhipicephalus sanguineus TaxID=34632 RepID=A0A9D4PT46_RHISA|nr:hypothetical protein HPB52_000079 [Rhipicephalus sanguineus]